MLRVLPTPGAKLLQRQPIGIVPLVLFGVIVPLATVGARQGDEDAVCLFCHLSLCFRDELVFEKSAAGAHGQDRTVDLTLTKGVLYH
jgi:hypothetical protein